VVNSTTRSIYMRLRESQIRAACFEEKNLLILSGFERRFLGLSAGGPVTVLTDLLRHLMLLGYWLNQEWEKLLMANP